MTNGERLRSATDRELAEKVFTGKCPPECFGKCKIYDTCVECWMAWLGEEEGEKE